MVVFSFIVLLICDVELLLESNSIDSDGIVWPLWSNLENGFPPPCTISKFVITVPSIGVFLLLQ